jgi:hypothetical protein
VVSPQVAFPPTLHQDAGSLRNKKTFQLTTLRISLLLINTEGLKLAGFSYAFPRPLALQTTGIELS